MTFDQSPNSLKKSLGSGSFVVLFEISAGKITPNMARELIDAASEVSSFQTGVAFIDDFKEGRELNVVDFASEACSIDENKNKNIIYLSGKNRSFDQQIDMLSFCKSVGFENVVPVTGERSSEETAKIAKTLHYTEDVHLLNYMKTSDNFFSGCVVNPFKYTSQDLYSQYFKMVKKINLGVNFVVSQYGWDMLKNQELRWYLSLRGLHYPSIARLMLLSPNKVHDIITLKKPGIHISSDFQSILKQETHFSNTQFESAQWRRIQLQVSGCKLLGYSGVQIGGIERPEQITTAIKRIEEVLGDFNNFNEWLQTYNDYSARVEMAPYPNRYYIFNNLFTKAHLDEETRLNDPKMSKFSFVEKLHYRSCKLLFLKSNTVVSDDHFFMKKILTGCNGCSYCRLPLTNYVCPETCPKGISNGPCGGTNVDGTCEFGSVECIHSKNMRIAVELNDIETLEQRYIKYAEKI